MAVSPKIKNPPIRKVRNRGFIPISYHSDKYGIQNGWIYKTGHKWTHAHFPSLGNVRISKANLRYVKEL